MDSSHRSSASFAVVLIAWCFGATIATAAQVSGFCFLADQGDHAGISVVFSAGSPSAVSDSTLTDAAGFYSVALAAGLYDVEFRKQGYIPLSLADPIFVGLDPVTLDDVTLQPGTVIEVSGSIGTTCWNSGTIVRVVGNAYVDYPDTLSIEPGVQVLFSGAGYYGFSVFGTAMFLGAEGDSILFASELPEAGPNTYNNISFNGCAGGRVEYCVFRHTSSVQAGGWCQNPRRPVDFKHCKIEWTSHGAVLMSGPVSMEDCRFRHNYSGIYMAGCDSATVVRRCHLTDNVSAQILNQNSTGWPLIEDCEIGGEDYAYPCNYGIDSRGSTAVIRRCTITGASTAGIAADLSSGMFRVEECLLTGNRIGIWAGFVLGTIRNNTIVANTNAGLEVAGPGSGGGPLVFGNIIAGNGTGLRIGNRVDRLEYNDVFGNGIDAEGSALPPGYGLYITTNANGDPADIYYNIALDPLFTDAGGSDYTLQAASPCLDAGDPAYLDPDGTVSDQGCFWRDQATHATETPPALRQLSCAPNPFNPSTTISFDLARPGSVTLAIYDLRGARLRTLIRGPLPAGQHRVTWQGRDERGLAVGSGIYVISLTADGTTQALKALLLR